MSFLLLLACFLSLIFSGITFLFYTSSSPLQGFLSLYFLAFLPYTLALFWVAKRHPRLCPSLFRFIFAFAILFRLILWLAPVILSDDIYRYLWDGVVFKHGVNPYRYAPQAPELASLAATYLDHGKINHPQVSTIYPPVMQFFFLGTSFVSTHVLFLKFLVLLFDIALILLLYILLREEPAQYWMLYAWNPLAIVEFSGTGHNDSVALFFFILGIYLLKKQHYRGAVSAVAASFLSKVLGVFLLFFFPRNFLLKALCLFSLLVILAFLPFLADPFHLFQGLRYYGQSLRFNDGLFHLAFTGIFHLLPDYSRTLLVTKVAFAFAFLALFAILIKQERKPEEACYFLLGFLLLVTTQLHPWYLLWILPLACLLKRYSWVILSATVVLSYTVMFRYRETGQWYEEPWLKVLEYFPFFLFASIELFVHRPQQWIFRTLPYGGAGAGLLCFFLLSIYLSFYGRMNLDEGYFLTAIQQVQEGKRCYEDFAFTQGPALPWIYSALLHDFNDAFWKARFFTLIFSTLTVLLALGNAYRYGGGLALTFTTLFLCFNIDYAYFSTILKTYSLAAFLLMLALTLFLAFPHSLFVAILVLFLSLLATLTRLSLLPFFLFFVFTSTRLFYRRTPQGFYILLALSLSSCFIFLLFRLHLLLPYSWEKFSFHVLHFHGGYEPSQSFLERHFQILCYSLENFFSLGVGILVALCLLLHKRQLYWTRTEYPLILLVSGVALVHFFMKTSQPEYQTVLYPTAALLLGITLARTLQEYPRSFQRWVTVFLLATVAYGFFQGWKTCYGIREERYSPVLQVQSLQEKLRFLAKKKALKVLTVEPLGLFGTPCLRMPRTEMGPFSLYHPLSEESAQHFNVITPSQLQKWLTEGTPDLVWYSDSFFSKQNPSLKDFPFEYRQNLQKALEQKYQVVFKLGSYGQFHEDFSLYQRKKTWEWEWIKKK